MPVPRVAGHPDYTAAGTSKFIPEIWSGKLLKKFYDATVLAAISNTDYEGDIKNQGDKVYIRTIPNVTIKDYAKGQNLTYERLESANKTLTIDKGKYFAFTIDRVDKYQSDISLMDAWSNDASEQMKIAIDTLVLSDIYADAASTNKGQTAGRISANINLGYATAPLALTKTNIIDMLVKAGQCLDENNVPESDRWFILPAWAITLMKLSDLKDASLTGDGRSILRNGRVGMIDRFTVYSSNLLTHAVDNGHDGFHCLFGQKSAFTFITQITAMETLKAESTFGDLVRGLQIFGYEVLQTQMLGDLYVYQA